MYRPHLTQIVISILQSSTTKNTIIEAFTTIGINPCTHCEIEFLLKVVQPSITNYHIPLGPN